MQVTRYTIHISPLYCSGRINHEPDCSFNGDGNSINFKSVVFLAVYWPFWTSSYSTDIIVQQFLNRTSTMSLMFISYFIDPMILMYWFQFMLMLTRRTTVAADCQSVLVLFWFHREHTVLGICCCTVPILEIHTKSVRFARGETVQHVIAEPVFTCYITKA